MKKFCIISCIIFAICVTCTGIKLSAKIFTSVISDAQDACLDSGWCEENLEVNVNGEKIKISPDSCIENNGIWIKAKKVCHFK